MATTEENIVIRATWKDEMTGEVKKAVESVTSMNKGIKETVKTTDTFNKAGVKTIKMLKTVTGGATKLNRSGRILARQQVLTNRLFTGSAQKLVDNATNINKLGKQYDSLGGAIRMPMERWKKFNNEGGRFNTLGGRMGNRLRMMTHGLRGFRMEMLGVMFFGQGMVKFFTGLLKPAFQATGIFELFSQVLQIVFLPIVLALLPFLLKLADWLINIPEPLKLIIGIITIFGTVLGFIIMIVGTLALGIGSIILAFGGLMPLLAGVKAAFMGIIGVLGVGFLVVLAVVIAAIIAFVAAWKENFGNIRDWVVILWSGIKDFFSGIWALIKGFVAIFVGIITGDTPKIKAGFALLWSGVKKIFIGAIKIVAGLVVTLGLTLLRLVIGIGLAIFTALKLVFFDLPIWLFELGVKGGKKLLDGLKGITGLIKLWLLTILPGWALHLIGDVLTGGVATAIKGGRQAGGFIPHTGLYKLHAGETVSPAGGTFSSAPTINVYASPGMDVDRLVSEVSSKVTEDFKRLSRR